MLSKSTLRHQAGSSVEFTETLCSLSAEYPSLWQSVRQSKSGTLDRFQTFIKHGSQSGPPQFWDQVSRLFSVLPTEGREYNTENVKQTLEAVRTGITKKDEPRANHEHGWLCYVAICKIAVGQLSEEEGKTILQGMVIPVFRQFIRATPETADWSLPAPRSVSILTSAMGIPLLDAVLPENLSAAADAFVERIKTSQPEQSKDYQSSQEALKSESTRWFNLYAQLLKHDKMTSIHEVVEKTIHTFLITSEDLIKSRKGKPYGAAAVIEAALLILDDCVKSRTDLVEGLEKLLKQSAPELSATASFPFLVTSLYQLSDTSPRFADIWTSLLSFLIGQQDSPDKFRALESLLDPSKMPQDFTLPAESLDLQSFILRQAQHALKGEGSWPLFLEHSNAAGMVSHDTFDHMLADITSSLTIDGQTPHALSGLTTILKGNKSSLRTYLSSSKGAQIMGNLLRVTESPSEVDAHAATDVNTKIQSLLTSGQPGDRPSDSMLAVLSQGLMSASQSSLSVPTLFALADQVLKGREDSSADTLQQLIPSPDDWLRALTPFLARPPPASLALSSTMSGAIFLTDRPDERHISIPRDADGYSAAFRIAWYISLLARDTTVLELVPSSTLADVYCLLRITVQLASDELGLRNAEGMWSRHALDTEEEAENIIWQAGGVLVDLVNESGQRESGAVMAANELLFSATTSNLPVAFHNARAYADSVSAVIDAHGSASISVGELEERLRTLRQSRQALSMASFLLAHNQALSGSAYLARLLNELIAGITGLDLEINAKEALSELVILNTILRDHDEVIEDVAKQRLIFFVKHIVAALPSGSASTELKTEICRCLQKVFPFVADIYGEHWSETFDFIKQLWASSGHPVPLSSTGAIIPLLHASLKLFSLFGSLARDEETNEDLKEAWQESDATLSEGLMSLLSSVATLSDINNQPLRILNELLARQIAAKKPKDIPSLEALFPLMNSESSAVQRTAFDILHRQIPKQQEQISLEAALDRKTARLPDELLSLVLQAPALESYGPNTFDRVMPPDLQTYLTCWLLIFDHFKRASEKVQADYIAHLKEGGQVDELLLLIFSFLGHARGKAADVSRLDVTTYGFGIQQSPVQDVQWLLSHLYFLCLKRVPNLTKTWWRDSASRQTKLSVETWTEKFISPHIASDALDTVESWARTQDDSADDALIIKCNRRAQEVTLSKEIDEQMMTLAIRLPSDFPLNSAVVDGVSRVAVDEKKWRSWIINCQGVINFSNNSLIEGITTFRRNLAAQLKGHTECAICYSLVSADKQLPTKKCTTCKNLFHGSCLYRWFKSSNSSSCPLCRNPFNYA